MEHDTLRSSYQHWADAAVSARLALKMASMVNPAALETWHDTIASRANLDRELRLVQVSLEDQSP